MTINFNSLRWLSSIASLSLDAAAADAHHAFAAASSSGTGAPSE